MRNADELVEEGKRLAAIGNCVVFLYPSQEWMAVEQQIPFLRYKMIPTTAYEQNARCPYYPGCQPGSCTRCWEHDPSRT